MLDVLGLQEDEELAYRHLVGSPSASVAEIVRATELDDPGAAHALATLESKGLVARGSADPERYVASPPAVALGALLVQRHEELRRAQVAMAELSGLYRGAVGRRDVADVIDVVHGADAVSQRSAQLQNSAREEVQALIRSDVVVSRDDSDEAERAALARGVRYSVVVERSAFDEPGFYAAAEQALGTGAEVRVVAEVPLRALIVDRALALVPMAPRDSRAPVRDALLVHPSGLLDALRAVFDFVWQGAPRLVPSTHGATEAPSDQLDALDTKVLSMLLAGLTDASIGGQLGLSLRTVQRRVRQMMNRAQVDTRLQLGYEAGRRGWV